MKDAVAFNINFMNLKIIVCCKISIIQIVLFSDRDKMEAV